MSKVNRQQLLDLINGQLSLDDLKTVVFDLDLDWANLGGDETTKAGRIRNPIVYYEDLRQVEMLIHAFHARRPDLCLADAVYIYPDNGSQFSSSEKGILSPNQVIILVADFEGRDAQDYRVTENILVQLEAAVRPYTYVTVAALGRAITHREGGRTLARAEGERRNATIIIWGWYGKTAEKVQISVNFEVLKQPQFLPQLGEEAQGQTRIMEVAGLDSFELQTQLSTEMAYLSLFTLGIARYAAEDYEQAITTFSRALEQTQDFVRAFDKSTLYFYRGLAYCFKSNRDYDRAIADFNEAIQYKPNLTQAYNNRGNAYANKGEYDHAIADYNLAIQLEPADAAAYNNRGNAYAYKGDYDRAIANFDQAIQLAPDFAITYYNRGNSHANEGKDDQAIVDFGVAIRIKPDFADAYNNRGNAYARKGDRDQAIADFNQALQLEPESANTYNNRGIAYAIWGDYVSAIADFDQAIQLEPDYSNAYNNRGNAYVNTRDYDRAIIDFGKALQLKPDFATAYYGRGFVYHLQGKREAAIAEYRQGLSQRQDRKLRIWAEGWLKEWDVN
jgi:tetratricopeptide (TPR) repeat protein